MCKKTLIVSLISLFTVSILCSQHKKLALANENYDRMAYMEAARLYEVVVKRGMGSEDILKRLGDSYYYNAKFNLAEKWYSELFTLNKDQNEQIVTKYVHVLKVVGNFEKLEELGSWQIDGVDIIHKIDSLNNSPGYFFNFKTNRITIKIEDAGINSEGADYGVDFFKEDLVFTSTRETTGATKDVFKWTNRPFSKLYRAKQESNGEFKRPKEFLKEIDTKFNEATATFSKDGNTMYFTRNSFLNKKKKNDDNAVMRLKLYKANNEEGTWTNVTELPFNNDDYNCAHPALSNDGKTLYFVSNMPGTFGASDLFKVKIKDDNTYGIPENLGASINTKGRETFPFISKENELFFSSDGHFGFGGLDLFVTKINTDSSFDMVVNIGDPINSVKDDFGIFVDEGNNKGFFSSNRDGGHGSDDIYKFEVIPDLNIQDVVPVPEISKTTIVQGVARDKVNGKKLSKVSVILYHLETNEILANTLTNVKGNYSFSIERNQKFKIGFERKTHTKKEKQFDSFKLVNSQDGIRLDVSLQPILDAKVLANLNKIYFNSNDSYIRTDASLELDKLVVLMLETYPEMIIKIEAHTDPVGSHEYNDWLSQKRATSTYKYLVSKGIPENRIASYKGFGKRKPVNDCSEANKCTPEELELNRRTAFPIVFLEKGN